jgi:3-oxoacyl-[acyl-carrier protein] reductase
MKTIIVTGDSRGLGAEIVETLLTEGSYRVVGLSRTRSEAVETRESEWPDRYTHLNLDLSNLHSIEDAYKELIKPLGPIYGLVNNAAMAYDDLVTNADLDRLTGMFEVNVIAHVMLTKYVIRDMLLNRTAGSIIHVSSVSTATGYKGLSMYAATKGALEAFSLGLARECGERGIRSNCVVPGFMDTDMTSRLTDEQRERIYARTGLGEPTAPKSVADTVEFLLSDDAQSISGETVRIDSGTL